MRTGADKKYPKGAPHIMILLASAFFLSKCSLRAATELTSIIPIPMPANPPYATISVGMVSQRPHTNKAVMQSSST